MGSFYDGAKARRRKASPSKSPVGGAIGGGGIVGELCIVEGKEAENKDDDASCQEGHAKVLNAKLGKRPCH